MHLSILYLNLYKITTMKNIEAKLLEMAENSQYVSERRELEGLYASYMANRIRADLSVPAYSNGTNSTRITLGKKEWKTVFMDYEEFKQCVETHIKTFQSFKTAQMCFAYGDKFYTISTYENKTIYSTNLWNVISLLLYACGEVLYNDATDKILDVYNEVLQTGKAEFCGISFVFRKNSRHSVKMPQELWDYVNKIIKVCRNYKMSQ